MQGRQLDILRLFSRHSEIENSVPNAHLEPALVFSQLHARATGSKMYTVL